MPFSVTTNQLYEMFTQPELDRMFEHQGGDWPRSNSCNGRPTRNTLPQHAQQSTLVEPVPLPKIYETNNCGSSANFSYQNLQDRRVSYGADCYQNPQDRRTSSNFAQTPSSEPISATTSSNFCAAQPVNDVYPAWTENFSSQHPRSTQDFDISVRSQVSLDSSSTPLPRDSRSCSNLSVSTGASYLDNMRHPKPTLNMCTSPHDSQSFPWSGGTTLKKGPSEGSKVPLLANAKAPEERKVKKPLRPLSAYNYFFLDERNRILNGGQPKFDTEHCRELLVKHWNRDRSAKRSHRKTHGQVSFTELTRLISAKWKETSEEGKKFYKNVAREDMQRYKTEIEQSMGA